MRGLIQDEVWRSESDESAAGWCCRGPVSIAGAGSASGNRRLLRVRTGIIYLTSGFGFVEQQCCWWSILLCEI